MDKKKFAYAYILILLFFFAGRKIVLFKNGIGEFIDNNATTLYVRL